MKSEEEIRARIKELQHRLNNPSGKRRSNVAVVALVQAEDALKWVLGENDEEPMSFQAVIDEDLI